MIQNLKRELIARYREDRSIVCYIEVFQTGISNDEIVVIIKEADFTIIERFKLDAKIEDIFATIDKAIYKEDYKYAYFKLKKFLKEHELDKTAFEEIFGDSLFTLKNDEIIVMLEEYVFSILCNDNELSHTVKEVYGIHLENKNNLQFKKLDEDKYRINENIRNRMDNDVNSLQNLRKEFKLKKENDINLLE